MKIKYVREGEQEQKWEVQLGGYYSNPARDDDNSDQTCEKWLDSEYFEGRHKGFSDGLHMGMRKGEDSRMIPQFWPKAMGGQNYILRWENWESNTCNSLACVVGRCLVLGKAVVHAVFSAPLGRVRMGLGPGMLSRQEMESSQLVILCSA